MKIKAYLIDPEARTLTEHEIEQHSIQEMYALLQVECFDSCRFDTNGDVVYVDDDGLLKDPKHMFVIDGYTGFLAGRGLVLGTNGPDSTSPRSTLEEVQKRVMCLDTKPIPDSNEVRLIVRGPPEIKKTA